MGFARKQPVQVFEKKSTTTGFPDEIIVSKLAFESRGVARVRRTNTHTANISKSRISGPVFNGYLPSSGNFPNRD